MKRTRYVLCIFVTCILMYIAIQQLPRIEKSSEGAFSVLWILFAFLVFAGNLVAFLFTENNKNKKETNMNDLKKLRKKIRRRQFS